MMTDRPGLCFLIEDKQWKGEKRRDEKEEKTESPGKRSKEEMKGV